MKAKFVSALFIVVLLSGVWVIAPTYAQQLPADYYCIGDNLAIDATGGRSAQVNVPSGSTLYISDTFTTIPGPGTFVVYTPVGSDIGNKITCRATGSGEETIPVPGCDVLMTIPKTAVVGLAIDNARLYWDPGYALEPPLVLELGKTAWVLGVDETLNYYRIIWVCNRLWVPIGTMGPNPDAVWMSHPLPTEIVD